MDYGKAIRVCRTASGLTQTELAKRLSIGPSQLSLIESGKRQPSVKTLSQISSALRVPPHLLTLLASEPEDLKHKENEPEMNELAKALLRLLISANDEQPQLPLKP
jgi:transcriptional regulator with XRE-family HTH domain